MAWATDVAAHIADALGLGLTSTRSLATTTYGLSATDEVRLSHRLEMLRYLLVRPQPLHVWYHFGSVDTRGSADDPLVEAVEEGLAPDIVIVRLRETDLLLDEAISTIRNGSLPSPTLGQLRTLPRYRGQRGA